MVTCVNLLTMSANLIPNVGPLVPQKGPREGMIYLKFSEMCAWISNFSSLSFELQVVHFFYSNNIVEVQTPGALFFMLFTLLSSKIKFFWFCVTNGTLPIREEFFYTTAYAVVFQQMLGSALVVDFLDPTILLRCSESSSCFGFPL